MRNHLYKSRHQFLENYLKKKIVINIYEETDEGCGNFFILIEKILNYQTTIEEFIKGFEDLSYYLISKFIFERKKTFINLIRYKFLPDYVENKNPFEQNKLNELSIIKNIVFLKGFEYDHNFFLLFEVNMKTKL